MSTNKTTELSKCCGKEKVLCQHPEAIDRGIAFDCSKCGNRFTPAEPESGDKFKASDFEKSLGDTFYEAVRREKECGHNGNIFCFKCSVPKDSIQEKVCYCGNEELLQEIENCPVHKTTKFTSSSKLSPQSKPNWEDGHYRNTEKLLNDFKQKKIGFIEFIEQSKSFIHKVEQETRKAVLDEAKDKLEKRACLLAQVKDISQIKDSRMAYENSILVHETQQCLSIIDNMLI